MISLLSRPENLSYFGETLLDEQKEALRFLFPFMTTRNANKTLSVGVAFDEHAFLSVVTLALRGVPAELSKRIGLGPRQESLLRRLGVLRPSLPRL